MSQPVAENTFLGKAIESDEAVTVLRRVQISSTIVDAQFISATPKALEFYGYDSLENFRHTWQSKTQALSDYKHTLALSLCRHFGEDVPRHYVHTLVQPNGTDIPVVKRTREVIDRSEIYWITQLSAASPTDTIPRLDQLDIPQNFEKYRSFGGFISVAEVEGLLAYYGLIHPSKIDSNRLDETIAYCAELTRTKETVPRISKLLQRPITKLWYEKGYLLECQTCGAIWIAAVLPERCNGEMRCQNWQHAVTGY